MPLPSSPGSMSAVPSASSDEVSADEVSSGASSDGASDDASGVVTGTGASGNHAPTEMIDASPPTSSAMVIATAGALAERRSLASGASKSTADMDVPRYVKSRGHARPTGGRSAGCRADRRSPSRHPVAGDGRRRCGRRRLRLVRENDRVGAERARSRAEKSVAIERIARRAHGVDLAHFLVVARGCAGQELDLPIAMGRRRRALERNVPGASIDGRHVGGAKAGGGEGQGQNDDEEAHRATVASTEGLNMAPSEMSVSYLVQTLSLPRPGELGDQVVLQQPHPRELVA